MSEFDDELPNPYCPKCGGFGGYLGALGALDWFRCIQCGWQFSNAVTDVGDTEVSE